MSSDPSVWIGEGGKVYLVDAETVGVVPAFDGPAQYLEALAIELETEPWPPEPERLQWHHISVAGGPPSRLPSPQATCRRPVRRPWFMIHSTQSTTNRRCGPGLVTKSK
ncbi:hypothetical protein WMF04_01185 [Sorangium sp. So ce260]|uniref:hypothetical protein n=1 Tax=Sorangium sp. So ce260 TaxID=3133291 RepID=UPI003F60C8AD